VTDLNINRPLLGEPNAPCRSCGSPLAADQRYCLHCGARRAEARLPFLDILAQQVPSGGGPAAAGGPAAPPPGNWLGRMSANAAAVAGVACLLLALGVGVLIGGLGQGDSAANATPQVISVGSAAPASAPVAVAPSTAAPAATETTGGAVTAAPKDTSKFKSSKRSSSETKATNNAVKSLDSSAGGDYAKKSEKLPKTLGTGGDAPPVDKSKPAGGGSDVESIG
jgi:hypothetical protein